MKTKRSKRQAKPDVLPFPTGEVANLEIPRVPKHLVEPVRALADAAAKFEHAFLLAVKGAAPQDVLAEHKEILTRCNTVVERWCDHLKIG